MGSIFLHQLEVYGGHGCCGSQQQQGYPLRPRLHLSVRLEASWRSWYGKLGGASGKGRLVRQRRRWCLPVHSFIPRAWPGCLCDCLKSVFAAARHLVRPTGAYLSVPGQWRSRATRKWSDRRNTDFTFLDAQGQDTARQHAWKTHRFGDKRALRKVQGQSLGPRCACQAALPVSMPRPVFEPSAEISQSDCFALYVHTKVIKRLESFRVNFAASLDQQRKILLPLSHGVSSTTLLHILDLHLKTQKRKTNRTGFAIVVLHIDEGFQSSDLASRLDQVQLQYPDHEYTSLPLHDVFRLLPEDAYLHGLVQESHSQTDVTPQAQFTSIITSLTSATARADVLSTLRTRLIVEYAKQASCESILWGDSTTRLAEKTLSETAKGRGFSLPWQVSDGKSPLGLNFHYPLRDVLKKELISYVDLADSSLSSLVLEPSTGATQASMSSKNTTIDDLMKQYFESVEENFPSIVSNVVRTTGKLEMPAGATSDPSCSLCGMPVPNGRFGIHGWGGDQHDGVDDATAASSRSLCYGCTRSVPQPSTNRKSV